MINSDSCTARFKLAYEQAHSLAKEMGYESVTTCHLLAALLFDENYARLMIEKLGGNYENLKLDVKTALPVKGPRKAERFVIHDTPFCRQAIGASVHYAEQTSCSYVGIAHLLIGILSITEDVPSRLLEEHGITLANVLKQLPELLRVTAHS